MGRVTVAEDAVSGQGHAFRDPAGNVVYASGNPCFLVRPVVDADGDADLHAVGAGVSAAAARFELVTYRGEELAEPDDDRYTPNVVIGPVITGDGVLLWADTKSEIPTPMLTTMVRILVEELERADARAHVAPGPLVSVVNPFALPDWTPAGPSSSS
jgi:hypothetical protein